MHEVKIYMDKIQQQKTNNAISKQILNIRDLILYNLHSFGNAQKLNKL
jgi:hypothetical protein